MCRRNTIFHKRKCSVSYPTPWRHRGQSGLFGRGSRHYSHKQCRRLRRKNRTLRYSIAYQGGYEIRLSARTPRRQHRPCLPDHEYTARTGRRKDRPYRNARQYAGLFFIDLNAGAKLTETARCITARQDSGISKRKGEHSAVFIEDEPRAVVTPDKKTIRQQGRWIKEPNEPMFTLTVQDRHGILRYGRVRKLTPRECWRLQGFADEQFDKATATGLKDGRLYKMAGNAVSVPVVSAVGAVIKRIYQEQIQKG